jgi:hypothetical protein
MTMPTGKQNGFVADGHERARAACKAEVRALVEQKYAERLAQANWFQRWLLRRKISRETARLFDEKAPSDAFYLTARSYRDAI